MKDFFSKSMLLLLFVLSSQTVAMENKENRFQKANINSLRSAKKGSYAPELNRRPDAKIPSVPDPLYKAIKRKDAASVRYQLSNGANADQFAKLEVAAPLHVALKVGHGEIITILLEAGADPNVLNKRGRALLHYASGDNNWEFAELLIKHGADPRIEDAQGLNAVAWALCNPKGIDWKLLDVLNKEIVRLELAKKKSSILN